MSIENDNWDGSGVYEHRQPEEWECVCGHDPEDHYNTEAFNATFSCTVKACKCQGFSAKHIFCDTCGNYSCRCG